MPRRRSTRTEQAQLDAQILEVLCDEPGQSVRHVFYRMTDPRLGEPVLKTEAGYRRVGRRCLALRRAGTLPWDSITDATRAGYHVSKYRSPGEYVKAMAGGYRAALWTANEPYVEVWVESRSIAVFAGMLIGECRRLAVSLYPCGGFASATLAWEVARAMNSTGCGNAVVVYVGDYDPAGMHIRESLERELRVHLEIELEMRWLAITEAQVAEYDLSAKPRKSGERRKPGLAKTVEAEALPARELRRLVREAVEGYLPEHALRVAQEAEASEREGLRVLARSLERGSLDMDTFDFIQRHPRRAQGLRQAVRGFYGTGTHCCPNKAIEHPCNVLF